MKNINQIYRIKDLVTGNYIKLGYAQKSIWVIFPGAVIKNNIDEFNYSRYQVDMFTTYEAGVTKVLVANTPSKSFTLDKKEI